MQGVAYRLEPGCHLSYEEFYQNMADTIHFYDVWLLHSGRVDRSNRVSHDIYYKPFIESAHSLEEQDAHINNQCPQGAEAGKLP